MSRYKLGKLQVKRLIEGKCVVDGHGRKFAADEETKKYLEIIDSRNLYDKYDIIIDGRAIDIVEKGD